MMGLLLFYTFFVIMAVHHKKYNYICPVQAHRYDILPNGGTLHGYEYNPNDKPITI